MEVEKSANPIIERTIQALHKKYGNSVISPPPPLEVAPTGLPELDAALGVGGIPRGRIVEIFGPESAGKTALALHLARQFKGPALYIDAEHSLTPEQAEGVRTLNISTLECALQVCRTAAAQFDAVILDSLAALPTSWNIEAAPDNYTGDNTAKMLAHALPPLLGELRRGRCSLIVVNQIRQNVGVIYGNTERVPGGHALKHLASVRLDVRRLEKIKNGQEVAGQKIRIRVVKNKCAAPFREAELIIDYGSGATVRPCER